jgi:hypothetical protein
LCCCFPGCRRRETSESGVTTYVTIEQ